MSRAWKSRLALLSAGVMMACAQAGADDATSEDGEPSVLAGKGQSEPAETDWHGWTRDDCDDVVELRAELPGRELPSVTVPENTELDIGVAADATWSEEDVYAVGFRPLIDNRKILHHFELYAAPALNQAQRVIYDWLPGDAKPPNLPDGMGFKLRAGRGVFRLYMHYWNVSQPASADRSGVAVCIVKGGSLRKAGLYTFDAQGVGVIPAQSRNYEATRTCTVKTATSIPLASVAPVIHKLGRSAKLTVKKAGSGSVQTVFDAKVAFGERETVAVPGTVVLEQGDQVTASCVFDNPTTSDVQVGSRVNEERCQFRVAYAPEHAFSCQ